MEAELPFSQMEMAVAVAVCPRDRGTRGGAATANTAPIDQSGQQMGGSVPQISQEGPGGNGKDRACRGCWGIQREVWD